MGSSKGPQLLSHQSTIAHFVAERERGRYNDGNDFLNMRFRLVCGVSCCLVGSFGNNQYLGAHCFWTSFFVVAEMVLTAREYSKVGLVLMRRNVRGVLGISHSIGISGTECSVMSSNKLPPKKSINPSQNISQLMPFSVLKFSMLS